MRRLALGILVAIGLGAAAATATVASQEQLQGDEVPIIVRDGSIIIATAGTFEGPTSKAYKHHSPKGKHGNALWVKLVMKDKAPTGCTDVPKGSQQVILNYSTTGLGVTFGVDSSQKTSITPNGDAFTRLAPGQLQYPAKKDGGRIASVKIGAWSCTLPKDQLQEIRICSSATRSECQ